MRTVYKLCTIFIVISCFLLLFMMLKKDCSKQHFEIVSESGKRFTSDSLIESLRLLDVEISKSNTQNIDIPCYYINLDRHVMRNEFMQKQKKFTSGMYTRSSGVDGREFLEQNPKANSDYPLISVGELGCTLAHLQAISQFAESGEDYGLILEDDADLSLSVFWPWSLAELCKTLDGSFTTLQLCSLLPGPTSQPIHVHDKQLFFPPGNLENTSEDILDNFKSLDVSKQSGGNGAQAYVITKEYAMYLSDITSKGTSLTKKLEVAPVNKYQKSGVSESVIYYSKKAQPKLLWPSIIFPNNIEFNSTVMHGHSDEGFLICALNIIHQCLKACGRESTVDESILFQKNVCIGDTRLADTRDEILNPLVKLLNCHTLAKSDGVSILGTNNIIDQLNRLPKSLQDKNIFISIGGVDLMKDKSDKQLQNVKIKLQKLIKKLNEKNINNIYLLGPYETDDFDMTIINKINTIGQDISSSSKNVRFISLSSIIDREKHLIDKIHINEEGSKIIFDHIEFYT